MMCIPANSSFYPEYRRKSMRLEKMKGITYKKKSYSALPLATRHIDHHVYHALFFLFLLAIRKVIIGGKLVHRNLVSKFRPRSSKLHPLRMSQVGELKAIAKTKIVKILNRVNALFLENWAPSMYS